MEQQMNMNEVQEGSTSVKHKKKKRSKRKSKKNTRIKEPANCEIKESKLNLTKEKEPKADTVFIEDKTSILRNDDSDLDDKVLEEASNEVPSESINEQTTVIKPIYNTRYLAKTVKTYCLETFQSNALIIFNHIKFENYTERICGKPDVHNIRNTFKEYNFHPDNIFEFTDYDRRDLKAAVKTFSECNFTHFGCVVVVVLTHGMENGYLTARDAIYHESELIDPFLYNGNQTLITKPKIFVIQTCACRRESAAGGLCAIDSTESDDEDSSLPEIYTQPKEADVLIIYGIHTGVASSCDEAKGSWLIKSLCRNIAKYAETEHLEDILTEVKDDVATENPVTGNTELHVVSMSTLIRKLYFTKSLTLQD